MSDLISRQAVLDCLTATKLKKFDFILQAREEIKNLPSVSMEKTDDYKQGWHDAITTALKETHSVHTEEGHFRVVQEETLIGVGMAYEQVSTEKTGHWEWNQYDCDPNIGNWHCSVCGSISIWSVPKKDPNGVPLYKYCPFCGAKMEGVEE